MYNKIIVAQYKMKHEDMSKKVEDMKKKQAEDGASYNVGKFADPAKKKAYLERMDMMKKAMEDRFDDNEKSDLAAMKKFGYMKMDPKKKALFDAYLKKLKGARDGDDNMLMDRIKKFKESDKFKAMSDEEKKKVLAEKLAGIKKMFSRDSKWRTDDDNQRQKAGYFSKMKEGARKVYDDKDGKFREMR